MRILLITVLGIIIVGLMTGNASAQKADTSELQPLVEKLTSDIQSLDFLSNEIASAVKMDHTVLVYRQDERSFRLLADFDALVSNLDQLPTQAPGREQITDQLAKLADGVGNAILNRIDEIRQRIIHSDSELGALSGSSATALQAYIRALEAIHVSYYETLVGHVASRKILSLSSDKLLTQLAPKLYLYAETLAGRIELTDATQVELQSLVERSPDNAEHMATMVELQTRHDINVRRLESIILVLDSFELDSSDYKAVMLQQSSHLSVSFLSPTAVISVLKEAWASLRAAVKENAPDLLFRLFIFLAVLFVFKILSRITRRVVSATMERSSLDMSALLKNILVSTSSGAVMALGVLMALSQVGISLAPMLAGLGVAGFIVGFALQDSLGNFAAGAMILIYRPFDVDDFVEVTGASGLVKKMNLVSTTITTFDNQTLVVPNSRIWGDVIKNVTAQKERRVDLEFGIGYDDDIELAERVLTEIVMDHDLVLEEPEPNIKLHTLGDSSVNFIVRPWTKTEDYWTVYWDIMREVKFRFDHEGISIPYPQRDVHLYSEQAEKNSE